MKLSQLANTLRHRWVRHRMLLCGLVTFFPLIGQPIIAETDKRYKDEFVKAKSQIELNCSACYPTNLGELLLGTKKIEELLSKGQSDPVEALWLLASAYNSIIGFADNNKDKETYKATLLKSRVIYKQLSELLPTDPEARLKYALMGEELRIPLTQQILEVRQVLKIAPNHAVARSALGLLLIELGQEDAGIGELRTSFNLSEGKYIQLLGERLVSALETMGREGEAREVKDEIAKKLEHGRRQGNGKR